MPCCSGSECCMCIPPGLCSPLPPSSLASLCASLGHTKLCSHWDMVPGPAKKGPSYLGQLDCPSPIPASLPATCVSPLLLNRDTKSASSGLLEWQREVQECQEIFEHYPRAVLAWETEEMLMLPGQAGRSDILPFCPRSPCRSHAQPLCSALAGKDGQPDL